MKTLSDLLVFDTNKVAQPLRFELWNAFIARRLLGVKMESNCSQAYEGRIEIHGLGDAAIVFAQGSPCRSDRGPQEIASSGHETPDWLLVRVNVPAHVQHCNRDERLQPGDLILLDPKRPYRRYDSQVDYTIFALSGAMVRDWSYAFESCAGYRFSHERGWARLLSFYIAGMGSELLGAVRRSPASSTQFTSHLISLLVKMVTQESLDSVKAGSRDIGSSRARQRLYDLMLLWIRDHFDDPTITAASLAQAFRVSVRYVHKLFATYSQQRGFLTHLQDVRMEHVIGRFQDKREAHMTISEIAWSCGFADAGSFARLFKKRYGMPPSAYRGLSLSKTPEDTGSQE